MSLTSPEPRLIRLDRLPHQPHSTAAATDTTSQAKQVVLDGIQLFACQAYSRDKRLQGWCTVLSASCLHSTPPVAITTKVHKNSLNIAKTQNNTVEEDSNGGRGGGKGTAFMLSGLIWLEIFIPCAVGDLILAVSGYVLVCASCPDVCRIFGAN